MEVRLWLLPEESRVTEGGPSAIERILARVRLSEQEIADLANQYVAENHGVFDHEGFADWLTDGLMCKMMPRESEVEGYLTKQGWRFDA